MIRVVHVLWRAHFGGIERLVLDLTAAQAPDPELEVSILFGNAVGQFLPAFKKIDAQLYSAGMNRGYDISPRKVTYARRALQNADVIHAHTFVVPLALSMYLSRLPVVYTEHGNFSQGRKRTLSDVAKAPLAKFFLNRLVTHMTVNSNYTFKLWQERGGLNGIRRSIVPNGIDFSSAAHDSISPAIDLATWANDSFIVGTSSRFASVKRIDWLIEAFARFQIGRDAKLLLVGDGPLRCAFEKKVLELGISDRTLFTGFRSDVRACQSVMNVCAFPSISESFGLACAETLSLGKPTIVFADGGGMAEIIRPLNPDDVVDDILSLAHRLAFYYDNPLARNSAASEQRRNYAKRYDIKETAAQFKKIYQSILEPSQ